MENMLMNPTQLTQMGQVPFYLMPDAHNWMKQAQGADAATLQEIMAQRQRTAQLHPLKMQQEQATLESTFLDNQTKQLGLQKTRALQPKQIDNELLKLATEADENEWKQTELKIRNGVLQNNPEALKLYEQLPAIREARLQHQQNMEKEREQTSRAVKVANIGASAKVAAKGPSDFMTTLNTKYKAIEEKYGAIKAELARLQATEPDSVLIPQLIAMEETLRPIVQEKIDAKATTGGLVQDANGKWIVRPGLQLGAPAQGSPANRENRPAPNTLYAKNPQTKQRIQSTDGGKTWHPVK